MVSSCTKDFVVKKLDNTSVSVLAPVDNFSTPNNAVTFWWEQLEGAERYNIQIVKPSFNAIQQLIIDTNVIGTKFHFTLSPGSYQWRIKGFNTGSSSQYSLFSLKIDTTSNLGSQLVIPIAPVSNYLTGSAKVNFSWNSISAADKYEIQIINSSSTVIKDSTTANTTFTCTLSTGGVYTWKVRAMNDFSISQYNSPLTFTVDLTPPTVSVLLSPTHGSSVKDTIDLKWNRSSTDTKYDSVFVSIDSAFASIVSSARVYATKIKINAFNPIVPVSSSYYWWRLRSVDSVGNRSGFSNQLKFKVIP